MDVRNPKATRPWQHVLDPLFGYLEFIETRLSGELGEVDVLNFGPYEKSLEVQEVLSIAKKFFKNSLSVSESSNSSLEKRFLDLDSRLAAKSIGWKPRWTQKEAINLTFNWWKEVLSGSTSALDKCREDIELYFNQ